MKIQYFNNNNMNNFNNENYSKNENIDNLILDDNEKKKLNKNKGKQLNYMVTTYYKYNMSQNQFKELSGNKEFSVVVDRVCIQN